MKTTLAALLAVAALSTGALAASEDRAPVYPNNETAVSSSTTNTFEAAPAPTQRVHAPYVNWTQLR